MTIDQRGFEGALVKDHFVSEYPDIAQKDGQRLEWFDDEVLEIFPNLVIDEEETERVRDLSGNSKSIVLKLKSEAKVSISNPDLFKNILGIKNSNASFYKEFLEEKYHEPIVFCITFVGDNCGFYSVFKRDIERVERKEIEPKVLYQEYLVRDAFDHIKAQMKLTAYYLLTNEENRY